MPRGTLKSGDLHRLYDEWKSAQPKERHIPNGMGRYTREEFAARIKAGKELARGFAAV